MAMVLVMSATIVSQLPMLINATMIVMASAMRAMSANSVKFTQLTTMFSILKIIMMTTMMKDTNLRLTTMKSQRNLVLARFTSKYQRKTTRTKLETATKIMKRLFSQILMENAMLLVQISMIMIRFSLVVVVIVTIVHHLMTVSSVIPLHHNSL
jgi:hypothetical protein